MISSRDTGLHVSHGRSILRISTKFEVLLISVSSHMCRELWLHTKGHSSVLERCTQPISDRFLVWEGQQSQGPDIYLKVLLEGKVHGLAMQL